MGSTRALPGYEPFVISSAGESDQALRDRMARDGYLLVRGLAPREKALKLRMDTLELCAAAGWLDAQRPLMDGAWSGTATFTEGEAPYMALYKQMLHLPSFLDLPEDESLVKFMARLLEGPVLVHQRKIGRITFPNNTAQATGAHQDFFYIGGTPRTYTMWTPLGDCPMELGGLAVYRGSHRGGFVEHSRIPGKKYADQGTPEDRLPKDRDYAWHAGDFQLGDVVVFHSHTIHKALPNVTKDRLRLSADNRYQRQDEPISPGSMETHYGL